MGTSIIRCEDHPEFLVYCKNDSYPTGIGFELLTHMSSIDKTDIYGEFTDYFGKDKNRFEFVTEIPKDIEYEYILQNDGNIHCQENWYAKDKSYHGGGFRHGGTYDLLKLKERERLISENTIRRKEYWN